MASVRHLFELQQTDSALDALRAALQQVEARLGESEALLTARGELQARKSALADIEKKQRSEETEARDLKAKAAELERKMYSGQVKNSKELTSYTAELAMFRKQQREHEDAALNAMVEAEGVKGEVDERAKSLDKQESDWREEQGGLLAERKRLQQEIAGGESRRAVLAAAVDGSELKLYEDLRTRKQGRAVAPIERGMCQGCRMNLPLSIMQRARSGQTLVTCSNCGRILVLS